MGKLTVISFWFVLVVRLVTAADLVDESVLKSFSQEISGEAAKRNLEYIVRQHRMRGSRGYIAAAEFIADELRKYGLEDVRIEQLPADGKIFYGTQRSRPAWNAEFAELWEMRKTPQGLVRESRLASWDATPLALAQDSESGEVTTFLIDVGNGILDSDYAGKDVRNKLVLAAQQPEAVARIAIEKLGAAGIISYAQNQRQAWWGENENLLRWGHLGTFAAKPAFAFMFTLKQARAFQQRLAAGEQILLHAKVIAGKTNAAYQVVTATIPGSDPVLKDQEIVFSCHLDHPRPGANDNASGCATILEIARAYAKLIAEKKIERPARTLRFAWPPEIEGTLAFLTAREDIRKRIKSAIHLDMVGGGPETKAVFHITRGPASRPSFIYDVADYFGKFVNRETALFADSGSAAFPLNSPDGGKEPLRAELAHFSMGSDHEIYAESSFGIPAIYFNDWPDRYIHTNFDTSANIDSTKLKRAGFIGAVTANFLANVTPNDADKLQQLFKACAVERLAQAFDRSLRLNSDNAKKVQGFRIWYERAIIKSLKDYIDLPDSFGADSERFLGTLQPVVGEPVALEPSGSSPVYERNPEIKGPMTAFGYGYLEDKLGSEKSKALRFPKHHGFWAEAGVYSYEALNFVDGLRTVREIRDLLSGAYGPVPEDMIQEYFAALESIGVIRKR